MRSKAGVLHILRCRTAALALTKVFVKDEESFMKEEFSGKKVSVKEREKIVPAKPDV